MSEFPIQPRQLKIFFGTFISMFIMVSLQYVGVRLPIFQQIKEHIKIISPLPQKPDIMDLLRPKLETKSDSFALKKPNPIIPQTYASEEINADNANAYAVVDLDTGQILAEKNGDKKFAIASITKIMTSIVALDLASPNELFTIQNNATNVTPTAIGVVPGQKMTLEELLNGALLTSANDAAEAIRDGIDVKYKDNSIFVRAMNEKADFLNLKNSHFTNPQGFDIGDNYSSAEDLAVLAQYALANYPLIGKIVKKDYQFLPANNNHKQFDLYNWNGLLDVYPGAEGMKIGNTDAAGYTTIVVSSRGGKRIAAIILGAPGILERDSWAAQLLDLGFQKTLALDPVNVTDDQLRAKYATWKYFN